jgi:hypothetical protein
MTEDRATKQQTQNQENDNNDSQHKNEETSQKSWRPTDKQENLNNVTENPTGGADKSPAMQTKTGDPGRTPGKAEGEDFEE